MTELDLSGNIGIFVSSLYGNSNFNCLSNSGAFLGFFLGPTHPGCADDNCRQTGLTNSLQVNVDFKDDAAQIDIDPFNPAALIPLGGILHGLLQWLPNSISGTDTDYSSMAGALNISVNCGP